MSITVCLIVRDDRPFLDEWLKALGHQDQLVVGVVGDGLDGTMDWVEAHADAVVRFKETATEDLGFAHTRNMVSKYAECDWIHHLDSDERLSKDSKDQIGEVLDKADTGVLRVRTKTFLRTESLVDWDTIARDVAFTEDFHSRLYRNGQHIRWVRYIHEILDKDGPVTDLVHEHFSQYRTWNAWKPLMRVFMNYRAFVDPWLKPQTSEENHRALVSYGVEKAGKIAVQYDKIRASRGHPRVFDDEGNIL